uniref:Uncharacterized protein n=1 Tax=Setaria digitata TaxID=48799 RepID=A0A915PUT6_9BILA
MYRRREKIRKTKLHENKQLKNNQEQIGPALECFALDDGRNGDDDDSDTEGAASETDGLDDKSIPGFVRIFQQPVTVRSTIQLTV